MTVFTGYESLDYDDTGDSVSRVSRRSGMQPGVSTYYLYCEIYDKLLPDFDYSMACTNSYSPPGPEPMGPSYSARTVVTYQV